MPGGHGAQLLAPSLPLKDPTPQGAHGVEPPGENWPAAHTVHELEPVVAVNRPAGQVAHTSVKAAAAYVPALQLVHGIAPPLLY